MVRIDNIQLPDFPLLLAPMEDVSDPPFRAVCKDKGADLMYTEFISSEGLIRDAIKSRKKLDIFDYERPVGIQIFGGDAVLTTDSAGNVTYLNLVVGRLERAGDLGRDLEGGALREALAVLLAVGRQRLQIDAVQVLHDDGALAVDRAQVLDAPLSAVSRPT